MTTSIYRGPHWIVPQLYILGIIECISCFGCLFYSLYIYKTANPVKKLKHGKDPLLIRTRYIHCIAISSFCLCSISHCINIYWYNKYYWTYTPIMDITWYFTWFSWSFAQFLSYLSFLNRIIMVFNQSAFSVKNYTKSYLYILLSMYITLWMILCIIGWTNIDPTQVYTIEWILSIPLTLIDVLITVSMTLIFVSRLYKLVLIQTLSNKDEPFSDHENNADGNRHSINTLNTSLLITSKEIRLIQVSVRITILSTTSLISSLLLMAFRAISYWYDYVSIFDKISAIWLQIDVIINCVALMLFLPKTQKGFNIFCWCCKKLLSRYITKAVHRDTVQMH